MVQVRMRADRHWPQRRVSSSRTMAVVLLAFGASAGVAAWVADPGDAALVSANAAPSRPPASSFEDRFLPAPPPELRARTFSTPSLDRAAHAVADIRAQQAREQLARQMQSQDWRAQDWRAVMQEPAPPPATVAVPLPRARPSDARIEAASRAAMPADNAGDQRTLLQKLSDLFPGRGVTLASLTSGEGLFRSGPDLGALGYDSFTAVYDISAQAVYLPNGVKLEAHSGLGNRMDRVDSVGERMVGATPPGTYELKPREKLFHGVRALRMTPVDSESTLGRTGLLVHSYLLGPGGESNGCVSIRNYERFLKAYSDGEISRLVVVPNLTDSITASRRLPAPS
ncbi:tlde1 domain-containing protein [Bradyrhizobium sp.]|uniref:tlde1 domain-containing protein n=1 Tax=Bradyrhizobium sp. TaxID=376 RepID=UPI0040383A9A